MSRSTSTCSTATDSLPSTSSSASTSDTRATASSALTTAAATTTSLSYRDEQPQAIVSSAQQKLPTARQMSSHHHYHLPHQFQHPHHQNHHPHSHGVAVPTPTVPASYTTSSLLQESRHIRAASSSGDETLRQPATTSSSVTSPPTVTPSPNLLLSPETVSHTSSVSPAKLSARIRESGSQHRVTIDESNLPVASQLTCGGGGDGDGDGSGPPSPGTSSQNQLTGDERQTGHLALMYHSSQLTSYPVLPAIKRTHRPSFVYPPMPRVKK